MTESKITPGPWHLMTVGDTHQHFCPAYGAGVSVLTVAEEGDVKFGAVFEEADAHLISAAPDFLEAAEHIVASRSDTYKARNGRDIGIQDGSGEKMWIVPFDEMLALEAAIAKARGSE